MYEGLEVESLLILKVSPFMQYFFVYTIYFKVVI